MKYRIIKSPRAYSNEIIYLAQCQKEPDGEWFTHPESASITLDECETKLAVIRDNIVREYDD